MVYSYISTKFGVNSLHDFPRKHFMNDGRTDDDDVLEQTIDARVTAIALRTQSNRSKKLKPFENVQIDTKLMQSYSTNYT